ncbi:unnamed protein product [Spirodela intermedia]|uniref:DUF1995 domain-containing protein n=1 Tax=Spirodela intermedia TaxID=51605 RepID=A0A7I8IQF5_SPIIN|nr:unnamed protein product [Spirodela intermedia]CAA6659221.1 unnamed protein product [Spirodela intermedia]CAA6675858.1 unnamed protein product [Spirodela intermedia]
MAMLVAPPPSPTSGSPAIAFPCRGRPTRRLPAGIDGSKATAAGARRGAVACRASGGGSSSAASDVGFPGDYDELLTQAKAATELALRDNKQLVEIEFPTAGLESVPGDGEGGIEMTGSMQLIREFCDGFLVGEKARRTRIFFPEANEVDFARKSVFEGSSLNLDYLTKPSLFEDFGFTTKVKMSDRVKPEDQMFLVAYPYFNVNGALPQPPPFLSSSFSMGDHEIDLFSICRSYPGPWKVLRKVNGKYYCMHQQEEMPSLKEVALDILPSV